MFHSYLADRPAVPAGERTGESNATRFFCARQRIGRRFVEGTIWIEYSVNNAIRRMFSSIQNCPTKKAP